MVLLVVILLAIIGCLLMRKNEAETIDQPVATIEPPMKKTKAKAPPVVNATEAKLLAFNNDIVNKVARMPKTMAGGLELEKQILEMTNSYGMNADTFNEAKTKAFSVVNGNNLTALKQAHSLIPAGGRNSVSFDTVLAENQMSFFMIAE